MELFRDVYRRSWNLPFKREVLAHCSNLMNFGASDLAIDEHSRKQVWSLNIEICSYSILGVSKTTVRCGLRYRNQSALSRLEGDPVNGKVRLESKEEKSNSGAAPSQALPTHEAHFHQYGRIGVLFLDLYSSRALETGEYNPNANILNAKQIEFVMKALQIEDLNGILVCMDTNYTGRIISGVEKEKHAVATGLDAWSLNEKVFLQLVQMLHEWNTKKMTKCTVTEWLNRWSSGQGLFEDVNKACPASSLLGNERSNLEPPPPVILGVPSLATQLRCVFSQTCIGGSPQERSQHRMAGTAALGSKELFGTSNVLRLTQGQNVSW